MSFWSKFWNLLQWIWALLTDEEKRKLREDVLERLKQLYKALEDWIMKWLTGRADKAEERAKQEEESAGSYGDDNFEREQYRARAEAWREYGEKYRRMAEELAAKLRMAREAPQAEAADFAQSMAPSPSAAAALSVIFPSAGNPSPDLVVHASSIVGKIKETMTSDLELLSKRMEEGRKRVEEMPEGVDKLRELARIQALAEIAAQMEIDSAQFNQKVEELDKEVGALTQGRLEGMKK